MYLKILLIDYLTADGVLTSYQVLPKHEGGAVVVDRLTDVSGAPFGSHDKDVGGVRLYNSDKVEVLKNQTQIRAFERTGPSFAFGIEHMGLDVGFSKQSARGLYYFIAPHGFRATDLYVADPYDKRTSDDYQRKQFEYTLHWDTRFVSQVVEMDLRSSRGTFSFRLGGRFSPSSEGAQFLACHENEYIVSRATGDWHLEDGGRKAIKRDMAGLLDSLELKPTIFGVGIDVPKFIKTIIDMFRASNRPTA
jgi:hypothetical protein